MELTLFQSLLMPSIKLVLLTFHCFAYRRKPLPIAKAMSLATRQKNNQAADSFY
jgi:hypothetical protein